MKNKILKIIIILIIAIIILLAIIVGLYIKEKLDKINYVDINESNIEVNQEKEDELNELEESGYRTIALLGIDSREDDYNKGNRSDCIILAILNKKTKEVNLVSVYRDTYLKISGRNLDKVTHAYSYGGPELTLSTLNTNLDLDVTDFVTVNFEAVIECVDALGGIEIDITNDEIKYINNYVHSINKDTNKSAEDVYKIGKQKLNGVQALAYSRIRYTEGGDYKRTERMRTVLIAMLNKAKTMNAKELNEIANVMLPKIYTNIKSSEILSIIPNLATYKINENIGWPYETKGATIDGIWYGPAVTLESNVKKLHEQIYNQTDYIPSNTVKQISNEIIQKTGYTN